MKQKIKGQLLKCSECNKKIFFFQSRIDKLKKDKDGLIYPYCSKFCRIKNLPKTVKRIWDNISPEQQFWSKVDKSPGLGPNGDCWEWRGHIHIYGYGVVRLKSKSHQRVHRISYMWANNLIKLPQFLVVMHQCDNKICVNPEHLKLGTSAQNTKEASERGLMPHGEGVYCAKLTDEKARNIRIAYEKGQSKYSLSKLYNVNFKAIDLCIKRKTWKHVI